MSISRQSLTSAMADCQDISLSSFLQSRHVSMTQPSFPSLRNKRESRRASVDARGKPWGQIGNRQSEKNSRVRGEQRESQQDTERSERPHQRTSLKVELRGPRCRVPNKDLCGYTEEGRAEDEGVGCLQSKNICFLLPTHQR